MTTVKIISFLHTQRFFFLNETLRLFTKPLLLSMALVMTIVLDSIDQFDSIIRPFS